MIAFIPLLSVETSAHYLKHYKQLFWAWSENQYNYSVTGSAIFRLAQVINEPKNPRWGNYPSAVDN